MIEKIKVVLFDLGGVLVELGEPSSRTAWFKPGLSPQENWDVWLSSPHSQAFERGELSPKEFATRFLTENEIAMNEDTFIQHYHDWVVGYFPGALELLPNIAKRFEVGIFSNITEVHWPWLKPALEETGAISHYFASYLLGEAKPAPSAFLSVAEKMCVEPGEIFFVDDNQMNVEGARTAGILAERVQGMGELSQVLNEYRILD